MKTPTPAEEAFTVLVGTLRAKYPEDSLLPDQGLIDKHQASNTLNRLVGFYTRRRKILDNLDRQLLNAG
jgi:hypothetical protein